MTRLSNRSEAGRDSTPQPLSIDIDLTAETSRALYDEIHMDPDLERLTRLLLETLAKLADVESTYLTVFDWERREQEVLFVHSEGQTRVTEGLRLALPAELVQEALPGVTRSPQTASESQPDSWIAQRLGLKAYISVPIAVAKHQLFGMLCGASQHPRKLSEAVVELFESFAEMIARHVERRQIDVAEERAQIAEDALDERAKFIAQAEHRLKTPLTVLRGASYTLHERWDVLSRDDRMEFLDALVRNCNLLTQEVDSLLGEARANIQTRQLTLSDVDLVPLIRMIALASDGLSADHNVIMEMPPQMFAYADQGALYQVLGHLLDNAVKYSPSGGRVIVRAKATAESVDIDVIDEGVGIPGGIDIFKAFTRAPAPGTDAPGVGLGLHIVRSLVEAMNGAVSAHRNPSGGSTFTVQLPARAPTVSGV